MLYGGERVLKHIINYVKDEIIKLTTLQSKLSYKLEIIVWIMLKLNYRTYYGWLIKGLYMFN